MRWFGFGFNAFGQICVRETPMKEEESDVTQEVKVLRPTELRTSRVSACWSRTASADPDGDGGVRLAGFGVGVSRACGVYGQQSRGCKDAQISESHLTLAFSDRVECWDLQQEAKTASWSMELKDSDISGPPVKLPLVPGGYITPSPPFYHSLSPHLEAKSLALGAEHAILVTASGAVYTWGLGSHGQLGHGVLISEEEPRVVEALWGMPMSRVATGGWHSACISDGGDLYVWGWNESGQLGLPSRGLSKAKQQQISQQAEPQDEQKHEDVFISIQAFPALLDVTPSCEITAVSCGSRHTAAVTSAGDLYTWGWGEYGQLGHQNVMSSDEPQRVEFFREQQQRVTDIVCGAWNTFAAVIKKDVACA
ncbi:RCC1 domain-containing protein 1-like isoform X2 [Betta splendens]|uniref:RCC1 domain-containing protein 1-like isoform X2 n=1 Tax=Betta splendens TaxID=158456 RepID=A0A6P7MRA6_BETSP|nr:RCC1 domain-containing protein 1-like isoform X2 [Betta splendens]